MKVKMKQDFSVSLDGGLTTVYLSEGQEIEVNEAQYETLKNYGVIAEEKEIIIETPVVSFEVKEKIKTKKKK